MANSDFSPKLLKSDFNNLGRSPNVWKFNFQTLGRGPKLLKSDFDKLGEKSELAIIKHLLDFPDIIADSAHKYITNNLALYLYELANLANNFYESVPVLKDDNTTRRNARLVLISTTASILQTGLGLLGIKVLEKIWI